MSTAQRNVVKPKHQRKQRREMRREAFAGHLNIEVNVQTSKDGAIAQATVEGVTGNGQAAQELGDSVINYSSSGIANRHPDDHPDAVLGAELAIARAVSNLGAKLERRAHGHVKHNDDIRTMRAAQIARSDQPHQSKRSRKLLGNRPLKRRKT